MFEMWFNGERFQDELENDNSVISWIELRVIDALRFILPPSFSILSLSFYLCFMYRMRLFAVFDCIWRDLCAWFTSALSVKQTPTKSDDSNTATTTVAPNRAHRFLFMVDELHFLHPFCEWDFNVFGLFWTKFQKIIFYRAYRMSHCIKVSVYIWSGKWYFSRKRKLSIENIEIVSWFELRLKIEIIGAKFQSINKQLSKLMDSMKQ